MGQKSTLDPTGLVRLLPAAAREGELMHSLLAVMHCGKDIENESAKVAEMIAEARERCVDLAASQLQPTPFLRALTLHRSHSTEPKLN